MKMKLTFRENNLKTNHHLKAVKGGPLVTFSPCKQLGPLSCHALKNEFKPSGGCVCFFTACDIILFKI